MAITLEEAKKNVQDDLQMGVIDEVPEIQLDPGTYPI